MQITIKSKTGVPVKSAGRNVQIGVQGPNYYQGIFACINLAKTATKRFKLTGVSGEKLEKEAYALGALDANGEMVSGATLDYIDYLFYSPVASSLGINTYADEPMVIGWDGSATASINGASVSAGNWTFPSNPGNMILRLVPTNPSNPVRNIRIYQQRYATQFTAGKNYNPDWVVIAKDYGRIRFMDPMRVNDGQTVNFSDIADLDYVSWGTTKGEGIKEGWPLDLLIEILQEMGSGGEVHINLQHQATDACLQEMAEYLAPLVPAGTRIVIEESNEIWNFQFLQTIYTYEMAAARFPLGTNHTRVTETTTLATGDQVTLSSTGATVWYLHKDGNGYFGFATSSGNASAGTVVDLLTGIGEARHVLTCAAKGIVTRLAGNGNRWAGYRSSAALNKFRQAFGTGGRDKWRGVLPTQTVNTGVTTEFKAGIDAFVSVWNAANPGDTITLNSLYDKLHYTNYFGGVIPGYWINSIEKNSNPLVVAPGTDYPDGTPIVFCFGPADGMNELNTVRTVTQRVDSDSFRIPVNTTSFTTFNTGVGRTLGYVVKAAVFDLIDLSIAKGPAGDATYSDQYQYFNEQWVQAAIFGKCSSGTVELDDPILGQLTSWTAQNALAASWGLEVEAYEGGSHSVGGIALTAQRDANPRGDLLAEFFFYTHFTSTTAGLYATAFQRFIDLGGRMPSKFVLEGQPSITGGWGMTRWTPVVNHPTRDTNAVILAVEALNKIRFYDLIHPIAPYAAGTQTITGYEINGQVLSTVGGEVFGIPTPTVTYQWQRDSAGNGVASNISGATTATYRLTSSDSNNRVRRLAYGNGSLLVTSAWSGIINPTPLTSIMTDGEGNVLTGWLQYVESGIHMWTSNGSEFVLTSVGTGITQTNYQAGNILTTGDNYILEVRAKRGTTVGDITVTTDAGGSLVFSSTSYETKSVEFTASKANPYIAIISTNVGTANDQAFVDYVRIFQSP